MYVPKSYEFSLGHDISLEDHIGDKIKKGVTWIIEKIKAIMAKMKEWFDKLFSHKKKCGNKVKNTVDDIKEAKEIILHRLKKLLKLLMMSIIKN